MTHNTLVAANISPSENELHGVVHDTECHDTVKKKVYSTVGIFGDTPSSTEIEPPDEKPKSGFIDRLKTLLLIAP